MVWKYGCGFCILSMAYWSWCVFVCVCVCVCVHTRVCMRVCAKWGFRESRFKQDLKEAWAEETAESPSDLWSRLRASRRESLVWRDSGDGNAAEVGWMCLEKRAFYPTSTVVLTPLCCNWQACMADYQAGLRRHTVDIKQSWIWIDLIRRGRLGSRRKGELWEGTCWDWAWETELRPGHSPGMCVCTKLME